MKNIAIDIRPLLEERRGGVAAYALEMTRAIFARGDNRYALFSNSWNGRKPEGAPVAGPRLENRFTRCPNRLLNAGFRAGFPKLENLIGDFDALWLPNLNFIATRRPYAVTVHDLSFRHMPRFFTAKQRAWHTAIGVRGLLKNAARVVAVSEHTKLDVMETYGIPENRITVASPAVGAAYAPAAAGAVTAVREKYGLAAPYFLFLAALEPRKNVAGLIAAYERCKTDADLVIAGGRGWLSEPIFARAAASPKRARIKFIGYVPENDKPALYSGATAFVYPSFYEGFGMPPLEAMACGTPVVASRVASLGEVVRDAGLLADPFDHAEIAKAMDAAATDAALRASMRERGLARARAFSWEGSAAILAKLLQEISG